METVELLTAMAGDRANNRLRLFILFVNQIAHSDLLQGMYFSTPAWRGTQGSAMGRSSRAGDVVGTHGGPILFRPFHQSKESSP